MLIRFTTIFGLASVAFLIGCAAENDSLFPKEIRLCVDNIEAKECNPAEAANAVDRYIQNDNTALAIHGTVNPLIARITLSAAADALRFPREGRSCKAYMADINALPRTWESIPLKPGLSGGTRRDHQMFTDFISSVRDYAAKRAGC